MRTIKLKYKIDSKILDEMFKLRKNLPQYGRGQNCPHTAGLALLGLNPDTNIIDSFDLMHSNGGCSDCPAILGTSLNDSFVKLIKEDKIIIGMCVIRRTRDDSHKAYEKMTGALRENIMDFRKTFKNIEQTIWIVLTGNYFTTYGVHLDSRKRVVLKIIDSKDMIVKTSKSIPTIIKNKNTRDAEQVELRRKRTKEKKEKIAAEQQRIFLLQKNQEIQKRAQVRKQSVKVNRLSRKIKDAKEEKITLEGGYCLLKNEKGNYILWKDN